MAKPPKPKTVLQHKELVIEQISQNQRSGYQSENGDHKYHKPVRCIEDLPSSRQVSQQTALLHNSVYTMDAMLKELT